MHTVDKYIPIHPLNSFTTFIYNLTAASFVPTAFQRVCVLRNYSGKWVTFIFLNFFMLLITPQDAILRTSVGAGTVIFLIYINIKPILSKYRNKYFQQVLPLKWISSFPAEKNFDNLCLMKQLYSKGLHLSRTQTFKLFQK